VALGAVLVLYGVVSLIGITWGLPSRKIDKYLFGGGEVWSGEKIYRLAKAEAKFDPTRGADVDVDPITKNRASLPSPQPSPLKGEGVAPIPLTATEEDVAKIYLRYRLYTYQPDEMITMMALAGMRPSRLDLDPRLYQYGGLFIYPVGALIKLCGLLGLIDVRNDVVFYLDHPDEFGKFYIVARAYSAAWGLIGVLVVFGIARRVAGFRAPIAGEGSTATTVGSVPESGPLPHGRGSDSRHPQGVALHESFAGAPGPDSNTNHLDRRAARAARAGLLAALLFTLMPVVVCMSHEGKPHLPGAVLMLLAVYFAMRCAAPGNAKGEDRRSKIEKNTAGAEIGIRHSAIDTCPEPRRNRQSFRWMCVCCGAALGMVLSSWPIFVLIPLVAFRAAGLSPRARLAHTIKGVATGLAVYLVTNPYILINAFVNREVLRSNFGNSLAMYQIARIGEGFVRVVELTIEGATLPMVVVGLLALVAAIVRKNSVAIPLIVVATLFFLQFVLIGAGKPAEYGRFGIFTNTALAIGAACAFSTRWPNDQPIIRGSWAVFVTVWVALSGAMYLYNFTADTSPYGSRLKAVRQVDRWVQSVHHAGRRPTIAVTAEPAPYCCPPLAFSSIDVTLVASDSRTPRGPDTTWRVLEQKPSWVSPTIGTVLRELWNEEAERRFEYAPDTPISWANKLFSLEIP